MGVQKLKKVGVAYTLNPKAEKFIHVALVSVNASQYTKV